MQNNQYLEVLENLDNRYRKREGNAMVQRNVIKVGERDLKRLSKFELNTLRSIGNMFGIFAKDGENVDYNEVVEIVNKLTRHKSDPEKVYLMGLFFPEKLRGKNIHHVNPFP